MTETNSEKFLNERKLPSIVSPHMAKSVSQYRRGVLEEEVSAGHFREHRGGSGYMIDKFASTDAGNVISNMRAFRKNADDGAANSGGGGWRGSGGTVRQIPEIYSPLWLTSNLNLPRDRATINAWSRAFFALNPIVQNAISLHSTYPISKLNITCKNEKVQRFFQEMNDELNLVNVCTQIAQEYWVLGEAFVYAELNEGMGKWSRLTIQNPDYIVVKHSVVAGEPIISLRPDENLRRIVNSNRPSDIQQRQRLDSSIIEHVRRGENIPLSNFYCSHIARRISPYEVRGTGLIVSSFRNLMLFDQLRESKFAQAANLINPLTVVKVGNDSYKPSPTDLEAWRQVFEQAQYDKDFKIFTHEAVQIDRVGASGSIIDINGDVQQLLKEIYTGLMVPSVVMDGGSDVTYANGGVALDVLRQRYMQFRNMISSWLRRKIFAPISKINDFYEYKDGKKLLIVPKVEWNHMSLFDLGDYINVLQNLTGEPRRVSIQTLYRSLGLDWEDEQRKMKNESIQEAIMAREKLVLSKMPLNELRTISSSDEITEPVAGEEEEANAAGLPGAGGESELPSPPAF